MSDRLDALADIHYGKSPADVLSSEGTVPVVGTGGVYSTASEALFPGPAVVVPRKGSLGRPHLVTRPFWPSDTTFAVVPKAGVNAHWLFLQLSRFNLEKLNEATGVPSIGRDWLSKIKFNRQSERDQLEIARVVAAIDSQIEQTEALIAKQEQVRAGLMQDLFTRGVDKSVRLRPPREEAPELYHETELGWLPKEWSARKLEGLLAAVPTPMRSGPFGSALLKHELVENGVPLLGIDNVFPEQFVANFRRYVTPSKFVELERYRVLPHDVIITIMGTVGRCCVVPIGLGEMLSSKHIWTMTFDRQQVLPELICWQLNYAPWVASWFRREGQGGIMEAIQSSTLRRLLLPTPEIDEQYRIQEVYFDASRPLGELRQEATKLRLQRSGLMQDLLTGKVPVDALLKERAAA